MALRQGNAMRGPAYTKTAETLGIGFPGTIKKWFKDYPDIVEEMKPQVAEAVKLHDPIMIDLFEEAEKLAIDRVITKLEDKGLDISIRELVGIIGQFVEKRRLLGGKPTEHLQITEEFKVQIIQWMQDAEKEAGDKNKRF